MGSEMDVIKAAKAVCDQINLRAYEPVRALRTALAAHEAAPTVAVPVKAIRYLKSTVSSFGVGVPEWAQRARAAADEITKLLPPREPPRELVAEWGREAHRADPIGSHKNTTMRERQCFEEGFVSACRARWAADPKNGGA